MLARQPKLLATPIKERCQFVIRLITSPHYTGKKSMGISRLGLKSALGEI